MIFVSGRCLVLLKADGLRPRGTIVDHDHLYGREKVKRVRLERVQHALQQKRIVFSYSEEDGCGSLDFEFRGLRYHVWEYHDGVWGAETNVFDTGRSRDIEGDYEKIIADEILTWPDFR